MTPSPGVVVVGAGPCGLAAAIALDRAGLQPLVIEAGCIVNAITEYPLAATFFSTAEKLSVGGLPFITPDPKPTRRDALAYYRAVVDYFALPVRQYETVTGIHGAAPAFEVRTERRGMAHVVSARAVVLATGYWGSPNLLGVPGESLPHVSHTYREGHQGFWQDVVVVGGGNSAAEAALDLWRCGARVTLVHFGPTFDKKIKPWVLPDFTNRVAEGSIAVRWGYRVVQVGAERVTIRDAAGGTEELPADHVYLLTGFAPNTDLLRTIGVPIDPVTGIPSHDPETLETSVPGVFIAGVVTAGFDANKVFIENGRYHGDRIVARLTGAPPPVTPGMSRDVDGG
jgi:thioredoxin reductase (NADPH)